MKNNNAKNTARSFDKMSKPASLMMVLALMFSFFAVSQADAATYLTSQMQVGSTGSQVSALQLFLAEDPSIYPEALMTGYFGSLTRAAVVRFQARYGIPQVGRVGPQTLAKINALGSLGAGGVNMGGLTTGSVMSSVAIVTTTNTTIAWATNEPTRAKLFYDTKPLVEMEASADFQEPSISGFVQNDPGFSLNHVFTINAASNTASSSNPSGPLYYFRAMSIDQNNNVTVSSAGTFRTN